MYTPGKSNTALLLGFEDILLGKTLKVGHDGCFYVKDKDACPKPT